MPSRGETFAAPQSILLNQRWIEKWPPVAARALQAFVPLFESKFEDAQVPPLEGLTQKLDIYYRNYLSSMGLQSSRVGFRNA
jgi:hypothetical protein